MNNERTPHIKVFLIGGAKDGHPGRPVYEYTQTFTDKLNNKINKIGIKAITEVKFLTWSEAKAGSLVRSINDYNPEVSDPNKDQLYVAIIGHGWGADRAFKIAVESDIKLNNLILIDPIGRGINPNRDFNTVVSKIGREHFKVKFINFTDYKLNWGISGNGNAASWWAGRWDLAFIALVESGQGNSEIYRKLTQLGYSKYDLLSNVKCNHVDFSIMLEQCEDGLFNDIEKFIKKPSNANLKPPPKEDANERTPHIKVFLISGAGDGKSRDPVYEYTQTFTDKLNNKINEIGIKAITEVKFLTWRQAKAGSLVRSINDYNPKVSDPNKDQLYVAIIGHSWGADRSFKIVVHEHIIKLNNLILIDPIGRGISWKKDFNTVLSKIDKEHFKVKFINFTDYKLDWTISNNGNAASWWGGRWDLAWVALVESGQGNSDIYRKLTQLGYSKYDLLSNVKCNHVDFSIMLEQCEDGLFNDIEKFIKKAYY